MKKTVPGGTSKGFALPTVLISSVVMLIVLLSGLVSSSSVNVSLRSQYQDKVLKEALEAGTVMANMCLSKNSQIASWNQGAGTGATLAPNTDCRGNVISGVSQYVLDSSNIKTAFSVGSPVTSNGTQRVDVSATLYGVRTSSGATTSQRNMGSSSIVGGQNSFSNIAFGYYSGDGAQFAIVLPNGDVKAVGTNGNGRLGNGTTANTLNPTTFILPVNEKGVAAFTNFLSIGTNVYVVTASGKVFGAGGNSLGQLGNNATAATVSTPVQFGTLGNGGSNPNARFVAPLQDSTFVIASDNNIYTSGSCAYGQSGTGCGSGNYVTPQRVNLPAVNTSNPNTLPVTEPGYPQPTNLVADRLNMFVRMQGGNAYGWGINDFGQLGMGDATQQNNPVLLTAKSSSGNPTLNVDQLAQNGTAAYALDKTGQVWVAGSNGQGEQLGAGTTIRPDVYPNTKCFRIDPNNRTYLFNFPPTTDCNKGDGWQFFEWWPDGTWRFRYDSGSYGPADATTCAVARTTPGPVDQEGYGGYWYVEFRACDANSPYQKWEYRSDRSIYNAATNRCVSGGADYIETAQCNGGVSQRFQTESNPYFRPVPRPPYNATLGRNPKYTRVVTDFRATILLDETGTAWAAGTNNRGQLGTGDTRGVFSPMLKKVQTPAGLKVVDVYVTEADGTNLTLGVNSGSYSNSYFIMEDGSVYGAGANNFGQLGLGTTTSPVTYDFTATPVKMNLPAGATAKSVQSGFGTTVVLSSDGRVFTVGNNSNGQLGDGTTTSSSVPKANNFTNQRSAVTY